ncbi:hypothetical protein GY45DRAFT_1439662 [Cubamyces sp. BRFM 1775]|nr:hypothetical protein GY45DRAFT_1439662 [Cubamyces sp. BRFM 1775]
MVVYNESSTIPSVGAAPSSPWSPRSVISLGRRWAAPRDGPTRATAPRAGYSQLYKDEFQGWSTSDASRIPPTTTDSLAKMRPKIPHASANVCNGQARSRDLSHTSAQLFSDSGLQLAIEIAAGEHGTVHQTARSVYRQVDGVSGEGQRQFGASHPAQSRLWHSLI